MIKNKNLPHNITDNRIDITFCGKGKCKCPAISMDKDGDMVTIGGDAEGYTKVTKELFKEFSDIIMVGGSIDTYPGDIKIDFSSPDKVIFYCGDGDGTRFTKEEFGLFVSEIQNGTFNSLMS
tara:strand:+ start:398 stop:763 length:366 start_codon:yes stop_codon:yes gene_type:complete